MKIEIADNGTVSRDGEPIGALSGGTCILEVKVGPTVKAAIKKELGVKSLKFKMVDTEPPKPELTDDELQAALSERGLCVATIDQPDAIPVPPPASKTASPIQVLLRRAEMGQIPPPPKTDAMLGHRTPDFVEWVRAHAAPEDFNRAYENRRLPSWDEHKAELSRKTGRKLPGEDEPTQF